MQPVSCLLSALAQANAQLILSRSLSLASPAVHPDARCNVNGPLAAQSSLPLAGRESSLEGWRNHKNRGSVLQQIEKMENQSSHQKPRPLQSPFHFVPRQYDFYIPFRLHHPKRQNAKTQETVPACG